MDKLNISTLVLVFIGLIIGIALLSSIGDSHKAITSALPVTNESFTGVNATAVALAQDDMAAVSAVRNSTHDTLTVTTDYTVNLTAGTITVLTGDGTYYADYTYYGDQYIENSATRNIVGIIVIVFALAVLAVAISGVDLKDLLKGL